jgi:lipopolysaccharide/colanic/teichoic acid biosynthesis glycosyltransferase
MNSFWSRRGKRLFDLVLAACVIVLFWPVLLLVTLLVRHKLGSPVLFTQQRLGKDAVEFRLYKFRSMTDARDAQGKPLSDEERLTRFGKLLRSTSLDELPQTINVLKGEMSFIGPRAMLPDYKEILMERYPRRFDVLPGLTSLAAIRGRNALGWEERFAMDIEYVDKFGPRMDLYVFLRTIPVILGRKGIAMPGVATATRYDDEVRAREQAARKHANSKSDEGGERDVDEESLQK